MNNPTAEDKVRSASRKFIAFGVVLVCVILAAFIYRSFLRDQREDRIVEYFGSEEYKEANRIAKAVNLKTFAVTRLQDEVVGEFMYARMAICFGPKMPELLYGERFLQKAKYEKHTRSTNCVATAVSPDGYFLTAAHCLFDGDGTRKRSALACRFNNGEPVSGASRCYLDVRGSRYGTDSCTYSTSKMVHCGGCLSGDWLHGYCRRMRKWPRRGETGVAYRRITGNTSPHSPKSHRSAHKG